MNRITSCFFIVLWIITPSASNAMEQSIQITEEMIREHQHQFSAFVEKKHGEYQQLASWTDPNWLFGPLISSAIETFSSWTRYGQIEPEKTKAFLGRAFAKEGTVQQGIDALAASEENIAYINTVLSELRKEDLQKRDLGALAKAMQGKHHPGIPKTDEMATKNERGEYIVPDDTFSLFAATNLFAVYCVDTGIFATPRKRKHPRGGKVHAT